MYVLADPTFCNIIMIFSNYQFRFSLTGTLFCIAGLILFISLGTWQVFRAQEKQRLQSEMEIKKQQTPFQLDKRTPNIESAIWRPVIASGRFAEKNEILIDNIVQDGIAGYYVMTPFILAGDKSVIMVNRGWVPAGNDRRLLPETSATDKLIEIHGILAKPRSKPPLLLGELQTDGKVWLYFDSRLYQKKTGYPLIESATILLDPEDANGYLRQWPKFNARVGMHIGYAIMWYVFALIVLFTYIGVNYRKSGATEYE